MITQRELDLAEIDADLELAELFAEFDEHYYGGRRAPRREQTPEGSVVEAQHGEDTGQ